jgi:hypothetical protein
MVSGSCEPAEFWQDPTSLVKVQVSLNFSTSNLQGVWDPENLETFQTRSFLTFEEITK